MCNVVIISNFILLGDIPVQVDPTPDPDPYTADGKVGSKKHRLLFIKNEGRSNRLSVISFNTSV